MARFELNRLLSYDDEALLCELRRVAAILKMSHVTQAAFDGCSKTSSSTIRRRFGGWKKALSRAGLQDRFSGGTGARGNKARVFSDNDLLDELRRVWEKLGRRPMTAAQFNQHAKVNAATVVRRFGSWRAAIEKAALSMPRLGMRYSIDEYFDNLLAVWTHHGRQPKFREMDAAPSYISSGAYENRWGTWTKALIAFIDRVNSDVRADETPSASEVEQQGQKLPKARTRRPPVRRMKVDSQRHIPLGLRYTVIIRDHCRCVLCGDSPATTPGCKLDVDHIMPFSRGGKTVLENLRLLCARCNVGKGARTDDEISAARASVG